jgi:drug/metabolite transporter (DMT)-like permease
MKLREWGAFLLLAMIWGSSFLWIKIAVQEIGPFMLVSFRLLFGLAGLLVVFVSQRRSLPRDRRTLLAFLFMGIFNTALPFTLISWGETRIDSGVAAILNSSVPLFTIMIAHFWLHDEKITAARIGGLVVGFVGVVVLVSRDFGSSGGQGTSFAGVLGQMAVIGASLSYAVALTFSRRYLRGTNPIVQSFMVVLVADALMWLATPAVERPMVFPALPLTWFALAWLGLLGSCTAYLLFFYLNNAWGPTRASLVTYAFPVVGLILGVVFNGEAVDWRLLLGSALVVGGIGVVNFMQKSPQPAPVQQPVLSSPQSSPEH